MFAFFLVRSISSLSPFPRVDLYCLILKFKSPCTFSRRYSQNQYKCSEGLLRCLLSNYFLSFMLASVSSRIISFFPQAIDLASTAGILRSVHSSKNNSNANELRHAMEIMPRILCKNISVRMWSRRSVVIDTAMIASSPTYNLAMTDAAPKCSTREAMEATVNLDGEENSCRGRCYSTAS